MVAVGGRIGFSSLIGPGGSRGAGGLGSGPPILVHSAMLLGLYPVGLLGHSGLWPAIICSLVSFVSLNWYVPLEASMPWYSFATRLG